MLALTITGMTCVDCATHIEQSLKKLPNIATAKVSFPESLATIDAEDDQLNIIRDCIVSLGYEVVDYSVVKPVTKPDGETMQVAIIGSGSAAFACAIKAAEDGAKVTMIEAAEVIGGCCVNVGCVPSKILIRAAQLAENQRNNPFEGLKNHTPELNRALLARQQTARVNELRVAKYENILQSNASINLLKGFAKFKNNNTLIVRRPIAHETNKGTKEKEYSDEEITAQNILIATGSTPTIPPIKGLEGTPYWTSTEALFADSIPSHLLVIGSSVVALEIAQAYRRLGSAVTILARHTLLYKEDPLLGQGLQHCFEKEGIKVLSNTQASQVSFANDQFTLNTDQGLVIADKLLISTGRHANVTDLNLSAVGVSTDDQGNIIVNHQMETSAENIYAAGDCSNMPQYVYVAAAAGSRAGVNMTGGKAALDLATMPAVIFTDPQVATVGLSEVAATAQGISTKSRLLELENVPRALANFNTDGFIKLVCDAENEILLGAQILAHDGGEIIQTAALAIHNKMTVTDLANQLFPYLTMVEGLKLCAQTFNKDVKELSCCAG